jgi:hypothetical protein
MPKNHHAITRVLGTEAKADDLGLCHHGITIAQDTEEEVDDPDLHDIHMTTKTTKLRWVRHALLTEFTENQYLKDSNYPMINRNTKGRKNHSHGYQTICKQ